MRNEATAEERLNKKPLRDKACDRTVPAGSEGEVMPGFLDREV